MLLRSLGLCVASQTTYPQPGQKFIAIRLRADIWCTIEGYFERKGTDVTDVADASFGVTSPDAVVRSALSAFARNGYSGAKVEALAKQTGMTKRMIHYHFGDKRGLYTAALRLALEQLAPPENILNRSHAVPVEGMRRFVDALYHAFLHNPDAVRLILRENLDPALETEDASALTGVRDVTLHAERLLLAGQDAGAFRPGITAVDVLTLISSLCLYRVGNAATAKHVFGVDVESRRNVDGMRRMVIDAVLAFLTSNISYSGYESYIEATPAPAEDADPDELFDIYGDEGRIV